MCAEALWTRCHRRIVADALIVRGWPVRHIMSVKRAELHALPPFAKVNGKRVMYPGIQLTLPFEGS